MHRLDDAEHRCLVVARRPSKYAPRGVDRISLSEVKCRGPRIATCANNRRPRSSGPVFRPGRLAIVVRIEKDSKIRTRSLPLTEHRGRPTPFQQLRVATFG